MRAQLVGVSLLGLQSTRARASATPNGDEAEPGGRDAGFRAVSGGPELADGSVLLVEAYAAIWILVLAFVAMTWRRMVRLERRLLDLDRALVARQHSQRETAPVPARAAGERGGSE